MQLGSGHRTGTLEHGEEKLLLLSVFQLSISTNPDRITQASTISNPLPFGAIVVVQVGSACPQNPQQSSSGGADVGDGWGPAEASAAVEAEAAAGAAEEEVEEAAAVIGRGKG